MYVGDVYRGTEGGRRYKRRYSSSSLLVLTIFISYSSIHCAVAEMSFLKRFENLGFGGKDEKNDDELGVCLHLSI